MTAKIYNAKKLPSIQFKIINDIATIFNLKHCQDNETLILKSIIDTKFKEYVLKYYDNICMAFGFAKNEIIVNAINNNVENINNINNGKLETVIYYCFSNIIQNFCGCKLEINDKDTHSKKTINYKLNGLNFFEHILTFIYLRGLVIIM